jgi:cation:H+ antiporter
MRCLRTDKGGEVTEYLTLLAGVVCAGIGGELFVRGTVGIASALRIAPGIIAATIAAFATSSPELTVSITAALEGTPQIALGDALGSNVVNVALILAVAVLIVPIAVPRDAIRRDFPAALLVPVIVGVLLIDGSLSRMDGLLLIALFLGWLVAVVREARRQRSAAAEVLAEHNPARAVIESIGGLALLIVAGRFIVSGATTIATTYGVEPFLIGATIVALGTSVPELATAIISGLRGHEEVGLGTILGSNIFNGLLIVGTAASISPISIGLSEVAPALVLGLAALALTFPPSSGVVGRWRGILLLGVYVVYLAVMAQWGHGA